MSEPMPVFNARGFFSDDPICQRFDEAYEDQKPLDVRFVYAEIDCLLPVMVIGRERRIEDGDEIIDYKFRVVGQPAFPLTQGGDTP